MPTLGTPGIRLALMAARARQARLIQRFETTGAAAAKSTSPPPPPPTKAGRGKPFLRRDPANTDRREGRNWEILVEIFNSLLLDGSIFEVSKGVWSIALPASSGPTGTFTDSF